MKSIKNLIISLVVGLTVTFTAAGVYAATLNVVVGQLHGATGVDVGGTLYDVVFLDGSCISVYGTCEQSSFTFNSESDATIASQALIDQVFINDAIKGDFDTQLYLVNGIGGYHIKLFYHTLLHWYAHSWRN